jgi:hypothetical protein
MTMICRNMTNEGSGQTFDQLWFLIAPKMTETNGFIALNWHRQGMPSRRGAAQPAVCQA